MLKWRMALPGQSSAAARLLLLSWSLRIPFFTTLREIIQNQSLIKLIKPRWRAKIQLEPSRILVRSNFSVAIATKRDRCHNKADPVKRKDTEEQNAIPN